MVHQRIAITGRERMQDGFVVADGVCALIGLRVVEIHDALNGAQPPQTLDLRPDDVQRRLSFNRAGRRPGRTSQVSRVCFVVGACACGDQFCQSNLTDLLLCSGVSGARGESEIRNLFDPRPCKSLA